MPALATEWLAAGIGGDLLDVHEFADLDDGRRLTLHEERGFTISLRASTGPAPSDRWRYLTLEQLKRDGSPRCCRTMTTLRTNILGSGSPGSCTSMASRQQPTNSGVFLTSWCSASVSERV
jgi:hypothetical protein